jgi:hypothetical protein
VTVQVTSPAAAELPELADIAARGLSTGLPALGRPENVGAFIEENLSKRGSPSTWPIPTGSCWSPARTAEWSDKPC